MFAQFCGIRVIFRVTSVLVKSLTQCCRGVSDVDQFMFGTFSGIYYVFAVARSTVNMTCFTSPCIRYFIFFVPCGCIVCTDALFSLFFLMYSERKNRPLRSLLALFERDGYVSSDFYDMKLLEVLETPFGDLDVQ